MLARFTRVSTRALSAVAASTRTNVNVNAIGATLNTVQITNTKFSTTQNEQKFGCRNFSTDRKIYSNFRIFKKLGALAINFAPPRITALAKENTYKKVSSGMALLQFATGSPGPTKRTEYDWKNKITFNCSVTEIGEIIAFHRFTNATDIRFVHDPNITVDELRGTTLKEFVIKRNGLGKGYFFTVTLTEKGSGKETKTVCSVSVTDGEFEVIVELLRQAIPQLLCMELSPEEGVIGGSEAADMD